MNTLAPTAFPITPPASTTPVTQGASAPGGWGVDASGHFAPITPPNTSAPVSTSTISNGSSVNLPQTKPPANTPDSLVAAAHTLAVPSIATPPPGATLVSGPSGLQGLTEQQIWRDPNSTAIYKLPPPGSSTPALDSATGNSGATQPPATTTAPADLTSGDYTLDPNVQKDQSNVDTSGGNYANLIGNQQSQDTFLQQQEQVTGATTAQKAVADATASYNAAKAAYDQQYANIETNGVQRGTAGVFYRGEQGSQQKSAATDLAAKAIDIQRLQGNYNAVEQLAQRAADSMYADQQSKIDAAKEFLTLNQDNLTRAENVAKSKMQVQITKQQQIVDEAKTNYQMALTEGVKTQYVNANGKFFNTADGTPYSSPADFFKAAGVKSFAEAYQKGLVTDITGDIIAEKQNIKALMAKYPDAGITSGDKMVQAQLKLQKSPMYIKDTALAKTAVPQTGAGAGKVAGGGGSGGSAGTTVGGKGIVAGVTIDPKIAGDVEDVLRGLNTIGNIRLQMGRSNTAGAYLKSMRDAIHKIDPNFDYVASDAGSKFVSTEYYQKSMAAINSVMPNIDKIVQLSDQVSRTGVAAVDALLQKGAVQIGDKKVANFREAQKLIADEIGLALGQGTVSDMKLQLGFDVTDPSVSQEVFASNMKIVKDFLVNRQSGLKEQRYSSSTAQGSTSDTSSTSGGNATQTFITQAKAAGYTQQQITDYLNSH